MKIERKWWKEAIVYQVYPRSFQDSDHDGIGDLKGISMRLDYLVSLGIDIIWLNPIFKSPNDDNGYDVSDYYDIMSEFGTMEDFNTLLREVHEHRLKLILDLVVNHTSDEHPWFIEAAKSRNSEYYHYYHWWPAEKGKPPFRQSYFDEDSDAWKYNPSTDSYYLHYFSVKQPDLNWDNPTVRQKVYEIIKFWLDKGIDGFRMDSIPLIGKNSLFPKFNLTRNPDIYGRYARHPLLHEYLQEMNREVLSKYDVVSVGEGSAVKIKDISKFVNPKRHELDLLYHFGPSEIRNHTAADSPDSGIDYSLISLKKMFDDSDKAAGKGWPSIYLGNHDQPRMVTRFGSDQPEFHALSSKMLCTFLLTMRGTPFWFAGDEIGMSNIKFETIEDYNDVSTRNAYRYIDKVGGDAKAFLEEQKQTARDNARTPMQWDQTAKAGFTTEAPWLKVNPNHTTYNVADEEREPDSILNYFKKAIQLRKLNDALVYGNYHLLDPKNERVYVYTRETENQKFLIALNFSPRMAETQCGIDLQNAKMVLNNYTVADQPDLQKLIILRPFEALVYQL